MTQSARVEPLGAKPVEEKTDELASAAVVALAVVTGFEDPAIASSMKFGAWFDFV